MSIRSRLRDYLLGTTRDIPKAEASPLRVRPGQRIDADSYIYAPGGVSTRTIAAYAMNTWVYTAISRLAEIAMTAELNVVGRKDKTQRFDNHPLRELIGPFGQPNDAQDSLEFLELHFQTLDIASNSYWHWVAPNGGAPQEVYLLDPTCVRVMPGRNKTIGHYEYRVQGQYFKIDPMYITHYRRPSPFSIYYGLSALDVLRLELESDHHMAKWNRDYFQTGAPSGILVIPSDVSEAERDRVADELNEETSQRRKTIVVRAPVGGTVWNDAAMKHHDLDFKDGRMLSRQLVFDALGLHTGLLSEASTEAHARVAERMVLKTVWTRHIRTASRLNTVLAMWPGAEQKQAMFEDVRVADWQQESMKLKAVQPFMTVDEVRGKYLNLAAMPEEDQRLKEAEARLGAKDPDEDGGKDDDVSEDGRAANS
jgi:hypothetical protein